MRLLSCLTLTAALSLCACSSTDKAASSPGDPADGGVDPSFVPIGLNEIQVKGTHNSYHVEKPGNVIPDWKFTRDPLDVQLEEQGVRAVELDTHMDDALGAIRVYHVPGIDDGTTCNLFSDCLTTLKTWSDAHPKHHVIFVHLEPKDAELNQTPDFDAYADLLDQTILSVFPRERVVGPADVMGELQQLRLAVTTHGWPTVDETRGKFLFYLNERGPFHAAYTRGGSDISGRLVFPESHADEPIGGVVILNDPLTDPIEETMKQGFLVRTMCDGVPKPADYADRRSAALLAGANVISTDYPVPDGDDPGLVIPDGSPSRCNPVTARPDCTPALIEHLAQ